MNKLINELKNSNYEFFFLVVDNYLDINLNDLLPNFHQIFAYLPDVLNKNDFCLEKEGFVIEEKNTGRLISHPKVIEYINATSKNKKTVIIPFKPSSKTNLICQKNNWINASISSHLNRFLEDKIKFANLCSESNIPTIPNIICELNETGFYQIQAQFGQNLVIQTHFGWAGNSTYFASTWSDIKDKIAQDTIVKISPLIDGYSLLNNCCMTSKGLLQSPPAVQYTGLSGLTTNMFATVGRQWPSQAPQEILQKIKDITIQFSKLLEKHQYFGFFGLDFFIDQTNNVYLLECNPRLTASFAFYTKLELKANIVPLFFYHLLQFINVDDYQYDIQKEDRFENKNIIGSEITKKNQESQTIKKYNDFQIFSETCDPIVIKPEILLKLQ